MKIASLSLFEVKAGWRPWLFLKVVTDEGIVGWSDCTDAHGSIAGLAATIRELDEWLNGRDPIPLELINQDPISHYPAKLRWRRPEGHRRNRERTIGHQGQGTRSAGLCAARWAG